MQGTSSRVVVVASLIAAVTVAGGAQAATKKAPPKKPVRKTQTLVFNYTASQSVHDSLGTGPQVCVSAGAAPQLTPCFDVTAPVWAKYMTITSTDKSGRPTPLSLWAGSGANGTETFVCGAVKNTAVAKGDEWSLSVDLISADPSCPGPITTGTVTVKLSNLP